jgi:hypothetical protein
MLNRTGMYINRTAASNVNGIIGACYGISRNEAGRATPSYVELVSSRENNA